MIIIGVFYYVWAFYLAKEKNGKESGKIYRQ